ncbi:MAG: hypothetical protein N3E40_03510, partial [Dehalococcoidia bacterium]|nr:hypothetical protein [Dehalococcoidia bacterium]
VIEAVAAGQRAALSIRNYLEGRPSLPLPERDGYQAIEVPKILPTEDELQPTGRIRIDEIASADRKAAFQEVVLSYTRAEAVKEASRCLRCDLQEGWNE